VSIRTVADSMECVAGLAEAAARHGVRFGVLVECETGLERCGVVGVGAGLRLARTIADSPHLSFDGLMTYPPRGQTISVAAILSEMSRELAAIGLPPAIVSIGGTPDMYRADEYRVATEHRPGTYIYGDRCTVAAGVGTYDDCALTVVATVVSSPTSDRAIIDAGSKTLTSDLMGQEGYGYIKEYPDVRIIGLSEEHGHLDLRGADKRPRIGERITIIPNHACVVSNLHDRLFIDDGSGNLEVLAVDCRGMVR
jgi:D-serine deaminase-like pyridoxal phosphate-dependent protein